MLTRKDTDNLTPRLINTHQEFKKLAVKPYLAQPISRKFLYLDDSVSPINKSKIQAKLLSDEKRQMLRAVICLTK